MTRLLAAVAVLTTALLALTVGGAAGAAPTGWSSSVPFTNVVASSPTTGGGYPVPPGSRVPVAGACRPGPFNANHSESWLAVKPGTEDLVGTSKFFFDKYSTFYMFYNGAYQIPGGTPTTNNQVQGYECTSVGTQNMPPSWTNTTDPNSDFDTKGRVYQTMLPYNSFFDATKLHPDGEIDVSYSDNLGRTWVKGNGGVPLEPPNNASAKQAGHVEDKQWIAVNHIVGNKFQDHVYAAWAVFNGNGGGIKVRMAVSRDRGQTFAKAVTIAPPSQVSAGATFVYPTIDAAGTVYVWSSLSRRTGMCRRSTSPAQPTTRGRSAHSSRSRLSTRCRAAYFRIPASATASPRASRPARPTPTTSTSPTRTGTRPPARWT